MDEYPSNTYKDKVIEEPSGETPESIESKVSKVVTGNVTRRKKSLMDRFTETFMGGADAGSVLGYVAREVVLPAVKDVISDAITQAVEQMLFGGSRMTNRRTGSRTTTGPTSYNRYSTPNSTPPWNRGRGDAGRELSRRTRSSHDFDVEELILEKRGDAELVLDQIFALVEKVGYATVADFYKLMDANPEWTDRKYGWTDLRGTNIVRVRGGWLIKLPPPDIL